MALIIRKPRDILMCRSGVASTAHSLSGVVDQLQKQLRESQEQLRAALEQNAFNCREHESQIATLMRDLLAAKYEIAKRDREGAFASAPSSSTMVH